MNSEIQISIDMNDVPSYVGTVKGYDGRKSFYIVSIEELRNWIFSQIPNTPDSDVVIEITGPMSNCVAIQIGMWLSGRGKIIYKSTSGFKRDMVSSVETYPLPHEMPDGSEPFYRKISTR